MASSSAARTRSYPSVAKALASSRPMPLDAPVTTASGRVDVVMLAGCPGWRSVIELSRRCMGRSAGKRERMPQLPAGPTLPPPVQSLAFARDPIGVLLRLRARYGPVFTLRLVGTGPVIVVADASAAGTLVGSDPERSHAGAARRAILPQASTRSVFGSDGARHRAARGRIAPPFAAERVTALGEQIAALAEQHAADWPIGRPFRLLARMRTLMEAIFVRHVLGIGDPNRADALVEAIGRVLRTPGNPPLTPPDRNEQRPLGAAVHARLKRRLEPLRALLAEAIAAGDGAGGVLERVVEADPGATAAEVTDELLVVLAAA
jgi:cytochrome P450 family 135